MQKPGFQFRKYVRQEKNCINKMRIIILFITAVILQHTAGIAQTSSPDYARLLKVPKQYTILSATGKIQVDGKDNEQDWSRAPWTEDFTDIVTGAAAEANKRARCKMLWDSAFLYVYAECSEQDIWASLTKQDAPVFQDNALEIFINPDGSTFNYFEFQINANETVWDLFMPRRSRRGQGSFPGEKGAPSDTWQQSEGAPKGIYIFPFLSKAMGLVSCDRGGCVSVNINSIGL